MMLHAKMRLVRICAHTILAAASLLALPLNLSAQVKSGADTAAAPALVQIRTTAVSADSANRKGAYLFKRSLMPRVAEAIQKQERILKSRMKNDTTIRSIGAYRSAHLSPCPWSSRFMAARWERSRSQVGSRLPDR